MFKSKVAKVATIISIASFALLGTGCAIPVENYYTGTVSVERSFMASKRCHVTGHTADGQTKNFWVGMHLWCGFKNGETITLKDGNYVG